MKSKYKMAYRLARETEVKENDLGKGVFKRAFIPNRANPETGEALPVILPKKIEKGLIKACIRSSDGWCAYEKNGVVVLLPHNSSADASEEMYNLLYSTEDDCDDAEEISATEEAVAAEKIPTVYDAILDTLDEIKIMSKTNMTKISDMYESLGGKLYEAGRDLTGTMFGYKTEILTTINTVSNRISTQTQVPSTASPIEGPLTMRSGQLQDEAPTPEVIPDMNLNAWLIVREDSVKFTDLKVGETFAIEKNIFVKITGKDAIRINDDQKVRGNKLSKFLATNVGYTDINELYVSRCRISSDYVLEFIEPEQDTTEEAKDEVMPAAKTTVAELEIPKQEEVRNLCNTNPDGSEEDYD